MSTASSGSWEDLIDNSDSVSDISLTSTFIIDLSESWEVDVQNSVTISQLSPTGIFNVGHWNTDSVSSSESDDNLNINIGNSSDESQSIASVQMDELPTQVNNCLVQVLMDKSLNRIYKFKDFGIVWLTRDGNRDYKKKYECREPCTYAGSVQNNWEWRTYNSIIALYINANSPLAQLRSQEHREQIEMDLSAARNYIDIEYHRPVYQPEEFLGALLRVKRHTSRNVNQVSTFWDVGELSYVTRTVPELESHYRQISQGDERLVCAWNLASIRDRCAEAVVLLENEDVIGARRFIKRGCPESMRGPLWSLVLGVSNNSQADRTFHCLRQLIVKVDLVVDKLSAIDIDKMAVENSYYFVHMPRTFQVMLLFTRDTDVRDVFDKCVAKPTHACEGYATGFSEKIVVYPPSGIIPFYGFCMFIAPMCSMYDDLRDLYFLFRTVYMRHFFRLHEVSSHPQGILCLCVLFERLLKTLEPELWEHFRKINDNPLRPVYKWLMRAFSGYLPIIQLMTLWDVIIAYDSLEVLPLLAVAIMIQRKVRLTRAENREQVDTALACLSSIDCAEVLERTLKQMASSHHDPINPATQNEEDEASAMY